MGWAGGSILMNVIIDAVKAEVSDPAVRERIYGPIFEAFRNDNWDTVDESMGRDGVFDALVRKLHPEWFEDDEDIDG